MITYNIYNKYNRFLNIILPSPLGEGSGVRLFVLAWLMAAAAFAQNNVLRIPEVTFPAGKTIAMPVELDNTSDIAGVQFDIITPYEINEDGVVLNASRTNGHQVSYVERSAYSWKYINDESVLYKRYRVIVVSPENNTIQGSSGTLLTLAFDLPDTWSNGVEIPVEFLSNTVILSDRSGQNVVTQQLDGKITIEVVPRPDIVPSDATITQTLADPGDELTFTWKVQNIGDLATGGGWTEKVFLENENGTRIYIGTTAYEGTLAPGSSVSRRAAFTLDDFPGISGNCRPVVQLLPAAGCGEIQMLQANNTATGANYGLRVRKYLVLTPYKNKIPENGTGNYSCELRRTGDLGLGETFKVTSESWRITFENDGVLTFPKNTSKLYFRIIPVDNTDINVNEEAHFTVNRDLNNGYDAIHCQVSVEDDDLIPLTLALDKDEYNEGDIIKLTASVPKRYYDEPLYVYLNIEQSKRFKLPQRIVFADGATSATVNIPVLQDKTPANVETIKITATADRHANAEKLFILNDDDTPAISLSLTPKTVSEGAGPQAMMGTLTRTGVTDNKITVKLFDDGEDDLYYSTQMLTLPAGTTSVSFPLGVRDNATVDGDRQVTLRASIYLTDCGCDAIGEKQTSVEEVITILDDDGPALSIATSKATILEGDEAGTVLTISRNTTDNSAPLTVSILHDGTDISTASTVEIPAGEKSVKTTFAALANSTEEGDRTVSITATARNFSSGTAWVLISDRTLPDATITALEFPMTKADAGEEFDIRIVVENIGAATLPAGTPVTLTSNNSEIMTLSLPEPVAKGSKYVLPASFKASDVPGRYHIVAHINTDNGVNELQFINNDSPAVDFEVLSLYSFHVVTGQDIYLEGESVAINSRVTRTSTGAGVGHLPVEPYIVFNGQRTALKDTTDAYGFVNFSYPLPMGHKGHFSVGVCNPGEERTEEMAAFDVLGFVRTGNDYLKHELFRDEPYVGSFDVQNLTIHALHNLRAEVSSSEGDYDIQISSVSVLEGDGIATFNYTVTGHAETTIKNWEKIILHIVSDEGATLDVTLYNYTKVHQPKLTLSTTSINTTVTKGVVRTYPIELVNMGQAETGKISVELPGGMANFISLATPKEMASLQPGDTAQVMLRFNPGDLDVNIIQKGNFAINCEEGGGEAVYFNVKVVSESKGSLRVQVQDESTIYGTKDGDKPYVQGATVTLQDYNTGVTIATGTTPDTSADGILFEDIPEGYYQLYVTADKHNSYRQNVLVSPGETTVHTATISYQAISYSWDVVETEVEDEYQIVTTLVYETMVPVPVIRVDHPKTLDLGIIQEGAASLFNIVLWNDGLIEAFDVNIQVPSANGYVFTPLVENRGLTLKPEQSYTIPVRITRATTPAAAPRRAGGGSSCNSHVHVDYKHQCGENSPLSDYDTAVDFLYNGKEGSGCGGGHPKDPGGKAPNGDPGGGPWPGGNGSPIYPYGDISKGVGKILCAIGGCLAPPMPSPPCSGAGESVSGAADCLGKLGHEAAGKAAGPLRCAEAMFGVKKKDPLDFNGIVRRAGSTLPDLLQSYYRKLLPYDTYAIAFYEAYVERFDATKFFGLSDNDSYDNFCTAVNTITAELDAMHEAGTVYDVDTLQIPTVVTANIPESQTMAYSHWVKLMPNKSATFFDFNLKHYIDRLQNTYRIRDGLTPKSENFIDDSLLDALQERADSCLVDMVELGFVNWEEIVQSASKDLIEFYDGASDNVCAHVKLEIEQKLVLTRQAFRGTLTIENDTYGELSDIDLNLTVTNLLGEEMTSHEFQINFESIDGFEGALEGPWALAPKSKGVATILFIPTKYAAPDSLTTYAFGGTLYITDGDGQSTTQSLYPVSLQVKPTPELDLTYFMQRDIYGDNPLTPEVVEPIIPAEFSVLIHNKGNGDATNVRMYTHQPKIVENEKNLLVEFAIESSSLNGGEKTLALDSLIATQFGDIPAGSSSYATWGLTSSLLGHFQTYDVSVTHLTSYGNPDLSLLDEVTIHELVHSVNAKFGDKTYRAWVCNDFEDGHSEPDHIYFSNGTDDDIKTLSNITTVEKVDATHYRLLITVPQRQWFYTAVTNPGGTLAGVIGITDETTGEQLDPQNFWTTQYTMQDSWDPIPDNRLHVVAFADEPKTFSFLVEFEPQPDVRLDVLKIDAENLPSNEDNEIAEEPIKEFTVVFNKAIKPETFTYDDLVLRYEGEKQVPRLPITMVENDSIFTLDTSMLTENGFYVLQVKTDSILDRENFWGYNGLQVKWMLFKDGLVHYNVLPWPMGTGGDVTVTGGFTTSPTEVSAYGDGAYGSTLTLEAKAAEGYDFKYWGTVKYVGSSVGVLHNKRRSLPDDEAALRESDIEKFSAENPISIELNRAQDIRAVFKPIPYTVHIDNDVEAGTVNTATGIYDYGTVLELEATANDGYAVLGFVINDENVEGNMATVTVEGNTTISVRYKDSKPKSLLLRESEDYIPEAIELANVTLQRSFRKGSWNTICLPVAIDEPGNVFGKGTQLASLTGVVNNVVRFDYVNSMEANVPYLIKPGTLNSSNAADGTEKSGVFYINGTSVEEPENGQPVFDTNQGVQFIGSYIEDFVPAAVGNYYLSSEQLCYVDAETSVPAGRFRGYVHVDGESLTQRMEISIGSDLPVGIIDVSVPQTEDLYTLDGILIRKAGEGIRGLRPGLYIMGRQKVRIR